MSARHDADEAMQEAQDEINDTPAGLSDGSEPAGAALPDGPLQLSNGQTYIRDMQKELVLRIIAVSGYRWHNSRTVNREQMVQIL